LGNLFYSARSISDDQATFEADADNAIALAQAVIP
jgi:hypothetical protein